MKKMEKLGKYQIRGELGRGAMGIVYEAFDPLIERTVAIKTILKSSVDKLETEETFNRFRREARAAGRLSHPKIVSIYEYGEDDDMAFIVMELIRGKELKEYFDHEDRFSIGDGIRIVMQVLDALDYSHARGVVHRDIKPANILITEDGQIKIADFGIAKIDSSILTQIGVVLGTPTYMSPEQFMGNEVDHRADIYATGVILYQFLTGARPFTGSVITIMHQAAHKEATPPSQLNPEVSKQLDEVVKKAMAKRQEDRFQSATEFMQALKTAAQASTMAVDTTNGSTAKMLGVHDTHISDETVALPGSTNLTDARRKADIGSWQHITNSQNPADFVNYLREFPAGEFAELAQLRIEALEKASALAQAAATQARLKQAAQARAALEESGRKAAEQQAALERAHTRAKAIAEAEAKRQRNLAEKARLARQIAEIRNEAELARAADTARREQEAQEQARRAKELAASIPERAGRFAAVVSAREAEHNAERSMKMAARRKLEDKVQRKKQAKAQLLSIREADDVKAEADAAAELQRQAAEIAARNQEIAEATGQAEAASRPRREAEELSMRGRKRTRSLMIGLGTVLSLLLIGILLALFSVAK